MNHNTGEILFEKFEIIECLKRDSYTSVYLANHIYLGKKIILKTLNTDNLSDQTVLGRFKREAKILALLDHPNLIKILDFGTYENNFYISFEYFESRNLREVIKENNLSDDDKLKILIQLLKALNIAHQNKIIHRDIKPENILLDNNHYLKIADFGLAMIQSDDKLTHDSSVVGTPSYMSPEQLRGEKNFQTDIFSTGIVAYELYTGINPFGSSTVSDTVNNILNYNENSNTVEFNKLPDNVRESVRSMLRKSPKERAKTILDVLKLLGIEGDIYKPVAVEKKQNYKIYVPAVLAVMIVIAGSFILFNKPKDDLSNFPDKLSNQTELSAVDSSGNSVAMMKGEKQDTSDSANSNERENQGSSKSSTPGLNTGKLFVKSIPYAEIYIDGKSIALTPIDDYIELKTGRHTLRLVNPSYPAYERKIFIRPDRIESVTLNFDDIVGYFKCNIYPWGKIFINGELKGITPMPAIPLITGKYSLTIKNPKYADYNEQIKINLKDTLNFNFNFEKAGEVLKSEIKTE